MIQKETYLKISDNSGGRFGLCIQIPPNSPNKSAVIGSFITVVIKVAKTHKSVSVHEVYKALVIRTSSWTVRRGIGYFRFDNNCCVLLDLKGAPKGKRIYGPILDNFKIYPKYSKILSLAKICL